MHPQPNDDVRPSKTSRWGLLRDGTWFAAFITLSIYVLTVVEERGQLRSDVRHLNDSLAGVRKELDAARTENKQLADSMRLLETDLAKKEVSLTEAGRQLSSASQDALNFRTEADTYKSLVSADKRCLPYKKDIAHLESSLSMSELDAFAPKGSRRQEVLNNLERTKNAYDTCMGVRR
ncbi:hypothetical protein AO073_05855 [Pseudomonas syringae ICMP 11293]|uniref:hypothetical protein n=1 Tax=Pseudomonas syringae TaxID=317 RepID=UPI000730CFE4|nr:hypothetical protein [Pseudomonas syringae]KTB90864.1 hypothetical protein AO073_05855 [Pseudomonas syringae ICMP 11293]